MNSSCPVIAPKEGLYVLHLFYDVVRGAWEGLSSEEKEEGKRRLSQVVEEARKQEKTQVLTLSMMARTDLGLMIISPDLHQLNALEKKISRSLGAEVLALNYSFFSLTEKSEYTPSEEEFVKGLKDREKLQPGTPEYEKKLAEFRERIRYSTFYRLYPTLPDWPFFCFYPMNKRRNAGQNWYGLSFEERSSLIHGHGVIGRKYGGKVTQLVTGCVGLDDWEWGVTLFAHDPYEVKAIVYEMRFDGASREFGEFGEFYTGLQLPLEAIYERLGL